MKVVVFNNGALGFIELEQKSTRFFDFGTDFKNPNFAAMAQAAGIRGIRLEDPADVEEGVTTALAHKGPVLIDAVVKPIGARDAAFDHPRVAKGFSLFMVKAILSGRGEEVIELARTNLWR